MAVCGGVYTVMDMIGKVFPVHARWGVHLLLGLGPVWVTIPPLLVHLHSLRVLLRFHALSWRVQTHHGNEFSQVILTEAES